MHQLRISIANTFKYLFFPPPPKFLKYAQLKALSQYNYMCVLDSAPHKAFNQKNIALSS